MSEGSRKEWAHNVLGPILFGFIDRLHAALSMRAETESIQALYCTRAGIRIKYLMDLYLSRMEQKVRYQQNIFGTSRLLAAKSCYPSRRSLTFKILAEEFKTYELRETVETLFPAQMREELDVDSIQEQFASDWRSKTDPLIIRKLFRGASEFSVSLRNWYRQEATDYLSYVDGFLSNGGRPILIDTGWTGTQQILLEASRPNADWVGMYFGRWGDTIHQVNGDNNKIGLMFNETRYDPKHKRTVIAISHHIIEDVLEPPFESLSETSALSSLKEIERDLGATAEQNDDHFEGVVDYFRTGVPDSISERMLAQDGAWNILQQVLTNPDAAQVELAACRPRSADFGKIEDNSVAYFPNGKHELTQKERLEKALWRPGQYALEYSGDELKIALADFNAQYERNIIKPKGSTAIITRTKDRAVLLKRAAESVKSQTHDDYQWVVVNDDGDRSSVEQVVRDSGVDLRKTLIVHRSKSVGMEAASNAAIAHSDATDYIAIHDDDDTWERGFLWATVSYLDNPPTPQHKGVVTGTTRVSEVIIDEHYSEIVERRPYNEWLRTISMAHLLEENKFAPIAFLFRRDVYDQIGGFNENLPVLGDWDFNLSYLAISEIGVIKTPLANYFHRDLQRSGAYSNSVIGSIDKHLLFGTGFRNDLFRADPLFLREGIVDAVDQSVLGPMFQILKNEQHHHNQSQLDALKNEIIGTITAQMQKLEQHVTTASQLNPSARSSSDAEGSFRVNQGLEFSPNPKFKCLFDFRNAVINSSYEDPNGYAHIQVVMTGVDTSNIEAGIDDWFDFRICKDNDGPFLEVFNHGSNFSYLGFMTSDGNVQLRGDGDVRFGGESTSARISWPEGLFDLISKALSMALVGSEGMDDETVLFWTSAIDTLRGNN